MFYLWLSAVNGLSMATYESPSLAWKAGKSAGLSGFLVVVGFHSPTTCAFEGCDQSTETGVVPLGESTVFSMCWEHTESYAQQVWA